MAPGARIRPRRRPAWTLTLFAVLVVALLLTPLLGGYRPALAGVAAVILLVAIKIAVIPLSLWLLLRGPE
jgi:ABC-type microcin C transport system permease subunit YejE